MPYAYFQEDWGVGYFGGIQGLRDLNKPVIACVDGESGSKSVIGSPC